MTRRLITSLWVTAFALSCYDTQVVPGADASAEMAEVGGDTIPGDTNLGDKALGAPCGLNQDCASGLCIQAVDSKGEATGWPGGACTRTCPREGCGQGQACVQIAMQGLCLASCGPDAGPCRQGYVCAPPQDVCLPNCHAGLPCPPGASCQSSGLCGPG